VALVLCAGSDDTLMATRKLILEQAGHKVVAVRGEPELIKACAEHQFDVTVIGQNIPGNEKRRILSLIRAHCPAAKVLELFSPASGKVLGNAHAWLEVPATVPTDLSETVSMLESKQRP
jgi:CheY-like chemotaxis protein